MTQQNPPKLELPEEARDMLRAAVKADVRNMVRNREELQARAATMRQVWAALVQAPTWSIVQNDKHPDASFDELWSMKPTVTKR